MTDLLTGIIPSLAVLAIAAISRIHLTLLKHVRNEIRYIKIRQEAMDFALQKSLNASYAKYRLEKLTELQSEDEFIRK